MWTPNDFLERPSTRQGLSHARESTGPPMYGTLKTPNDFIVKEQKDKAPELLPTQSGFFFGGTNYDEYYFESNDYTIGIIEEILKEVNERGYLPEEYYYQSSW